VLRLHAVVDAKRPGIELKEDPVDPGHRMGRPGAGEPGPMTAAECARIGRSAVGLDGSPRRDGGSYEAVQAGGEEVLDERQPEAPRPTISTAPARRSLPSWLRAPEAGGTLRVRKLVLVSAIPTRPDSGSPPVSSERRGRRRTPPRRESDLEGR
jgi:hypothetical protein